MSPVAFTATRADTTTSSSRAVAEPNPPGRAWSGPRHFPTVAPVPAPTSPSGTAPPTADRQANSPSVDPGRVEASPTARSNSESPTTMGTTPTEVGKPIPSRSRRRITPSAAAKP